MNKVRENMSTLLSAGKSCYKAILEKYPPLDMKQEQAMIKDYMSRKDREGLEHELVMHNVGLIAKVGRPWKHFYAYESGDIFSIGVMALYKAAKMFDVTLGYKFSSYAVPVLKTALTRESWKYRNKTDELSVSMDKTVAASDDESYTLGDFIQAKIPEEYKVIHDPMQQIENSDTIETLMNIVGYSYLSKSQQKDIDVFIRYHLSDKTNAETLQEIGDDFGVSRERIRQRCEKGKRLIIRKLMKLSAQRRFGSEADYTKNCSPASQEFWLRKWEYMNKASEWSRSYKKATMDSSHSCWNDIVSIFK